MSMFRQVILACFMLGMMSSCGSSEDSALRFIESGKTFLEQGSMDKARIEFKNAIQVDPRRAEPFYLLALMDEKEQKWKSMFANLTTVEQLDPNHYDAIVKLGQMHLLAGNIDLAKEKADKILREDNQNIQAIVLLSSIHLKQKNFESALDTVEKALSINASYLEALSIKILANRGKGNIDEALKITNAALLSHPNELPVKMIKLSILEQQGDFASMELVYRELMLSYPDKNWIIVSLVKLLHNTLDRYDDAKRELQKFIEKTPGDLEAKLLLIALLKTKEPLQATALINHYIEVEPDNYELRFSKIDLLKSQGKLDEVIAGLKKIIVDDYEGSHGLKANVLLAQYEAARGNIKQAELILEQVLEEDAENESARLLKAKLELKNNNIDMAITDLRLVLRINSRLDEAHILLAQAYLTRGSKVLAEDSFREALKINPANTTAALFIANSLVESGDLDRAEDTLIKALEKTDRSEALLEALTQVRILKKDWAGSESAISLLEKQSNSPPDFSHYLLGKMYQEQGKSSAAIEEYKMALEGNPSIVKALQGLATSYLQEKKYEELIDYLKQYVEANPEQLHGYSVLATIHRQQNDWKQAVDIVERGLEIEPKWIEGYGAIADIHYAQGDKNKAIDVLGVGLQVSPASNILAMRLASAYELVDDFENAKSVYESILARDPNIEPAINNLATLLTDQFESSDNLRKALKISSRFSNSTEPYYRDTYAWVNVKLGNLEQAQNILESVVSLNGYVAVFNYHLGVLYAKQGNKEQAKKYLNVAKQIAVGQNDANLEQDIIEALESI